MLLSFHTDDPILLERYLYKTSLWFKVTRGRCLYVVNTAFKDIWLVYKFLDESKDASVREK